MAATWGGGSKASWAAARPPKVVGRWATGPSASPVTRPSTSLRSSSVRPYSLSKPVEARQGGATRKEEQSKRLTSQKRERLSFTLLPNGTERNVMMAARAGCVGTFETKRCSGLGLVVLLGSALKLERHSHSSTSDRSENGLNDSRRLSTRLDCSPLSLSTRPDTVHRALSPRHDWGKSIPSQVSGVARTREMMRLSRELPALRSNGSLFAPPLEGFFSCFAPVLATFTLPFTRTRHLRS
eukprot:2831587-Prymnesium_polylepis.2